MRHSFVTCGVLAGMTAIASVAVAQANPDSVQYRNDCRLAAQVIATGEPAPKAGWARGFIGACPEDIGAALATAMLRMSTSSDTAALDRIFGLTFTVQDPGVFAAALRIAGDRSASLPARAVALRSLDWAVSRAPAVISVKGLFAYADSTLYGRCWVTGEPPHGWVVRSPLPIDYQAQARSLGLRLRSDPNESWVVRALADCIVVGP